MNHPIPPERFTEWFVRLGIALAGCVIAGFTLAIVGIQPGALLALIGFIGLALATPVAALALHVIITAI